MAPELMSLISVGMALALRVSQERHVLMGPLMVLCGAVLLTYDRLYQSFDKGSTIFLVTAIMIGEYFAKSGDTKSTKRAYGIAFLGLLILENFVFDSSLLFAVVIIFVTASSYLKFSNNWKRDVNKRR